MVLEAHTSVLLHTSVEVQSQSAQVPSAGPPNEPRWHVSVLSHQPHSATPRHAEHSVFEPQVSGAEHALESQTQPVHAPPVGPVAVPLRQLAELGHQPQPARIEHALQSELVEHGSPIIIGVVHTPDVHVRPVQQSAEVTHVCEPVRQVQWPAVQSIQPQHCALEVHAAPASSQQTMPPDTVLRQLRPVQHSVADAHVVAAVPHIDIGREHMPAVHVRPPVQAAPVVQQAAPSAPHIVVVVQDPALHIPDMHTLPHRPQLRLSVLKSMHVALQQVSPEPVHVSPAQHVCPASPQAPDVVPHVPLMHVSPMSQVSPVQQGSRAPPQAVAVAHEPAEHESPVAHAVPSQQG